MQHKWDKIYLHISGELLILVLWTLFITKPYLNMDPMVIPSSFQPANEYLMAIQSHHLWTYFKECGICSLWNGNIRGGYPSFVDVYGGMLHPLVIITNLLWGVYNGTKLALIGSFLMAGFAQWWLAYELRLGWAARLWSGCMAVVAGHLSRIELGTFGLVLSTAACALVFAPLLAVSRTGSRRMAVVLGIVLGLALLSGQGYLQIGLVLTMPAVLLLLFWNPANTKLLMKRYALAGVIGLLIAAPFLVPFIHFLPMFDKFRATVLEVGQPFTYVIFNLVINDYQFYLNPELEKFQHPWLYINYVGWVAIILAIWSIHSGRSQHERQAIVFFIISTFLPLWFASEKPLDYLSTVGPEWLSKQLYGIRYYPMIAGIAVPPLLALSAIGLDKLMHAPLLRVHVGQGRQAPTSSTWLLDMRWLLIVPLVFALLQGRAFVSEWIETRPIPPEIYPVLETLQTPSLQWVTIPNGGFDYTATGVGMGLKLSNGGCPWGWKGRPLPPTTRLALHPQEPVPPDVTLLSHVQGIPIYGRLDDAVQYATVQQVNVERRVCEAQGAGGHINVTCDIDMPGILTIHENMWSGWKVSIDGQPAVLREEEPWLSVDVPAGKHTVEFRYRPWDVPLGLALCIVGIALSGYLLWKGDSMFLPMRGENKRYLPGAPTLD